jgi:Flp pilus assembly protein CpaB
VLPWPHMKQKLVPLLGIAFVVALISTGVFYGLFVGKTQNSPAAESRFPLVVASRALARGTVIQAADIKVIPWAGAEPPKGFFNIPDQVAGVTVLDPIGPNEPIVESHIASQKAIPTGMRAVSIHVTDSSGVVSMLHPGNKVDVQLLSEANRGDVSLRTALQNIEVLTVSPVDAGKPVVNLVVTPDDAELLGLADSTGRVRLVLRNPSDEGRRPQAVLPASSLFRQSSGPPPRAVAPVSNPKISTLLPAK